MPEYLIEKDGQKCYCSHQDFALAAKSVRMRKICREEIRSGQKYLEKHLKESSVAIKIDAHDTTTRQKQRRKV